MLEDIKGLWKYQGPLENTVRRDPKIRCENPFIGILCSLQTSVFLALGMTSARGNQ